RSRFAVQFHAVVPEAQGFDLFVKLAVSQRGMILHIKLASASDEFLGFAAVSAVASAGWSGPPAPATAEEFAILTFQFGTSSTWGRRAVQGRFGGVEKS